MRPTNGHAALQSNHPRCPPSDEPMCLQFLDLQRHPSPGPSGSTFWKVGQGYDSTLSTHTGTPVDRCGTRPSVLRLAASPRPPRLDIHQAHCRFGPGSGRGVRPPSPDQEGYTEHHSQGRRVEQAKKMPARAFRFHGGPGRRSGAQRLTRRSYRVRSGQDNF